MRQQRFSVDGHPASAPGFTHEYSVTFALCRRHQRRAPLPHRWSLVPVMHTLLAYRLHNRLDAAHWIIQRGSWQLCTSYMDVMFGKIRNIARRQMN
jgi:hypothetical protein